MLNLTIAYDPVTRMLSTSDEYAGATIDNLSTQITVSGIPAGYSARLDFRVKVKTTQGKTVHPYLSLDQSGTCILNVNLLTACKADLKLPLQLVLTKDAEEGQQEVIASKNIISLDVSPSINAMGSVETAYRPPIERSFIDVDEQDGRITFTRLNGDTKEIGVDDDFVAWTDVLTEWPEEPSDDTVPSTKAVDDTFLKKNLVAPDRLLITDEDGNVLANGPRIVSAWSSTPSDDNLPTEQLVKNELDTKANDNAVVHNDVGTPVWDPDVGYLAGSTVIHNLEFYISQNDGNLGHDPEEEYTVWWAKVTGSGGGGDDPGAYRVFLLGDGSSTAFVVNHQFNSYHVAHLLYSTGGSMSDLDTTVERISKNHIKVTFHTAPTSGEYTIVVYRPGIGPESCVTTINGLTGDVVFTPSDFNAVSTESSQGLTSEQQENARDNIGLGSAAVKTVGLGEGNLVELRGNGKLPSSVIPAYCIGQYLGNVSTKADLVTLSNGEIGDYATVSDDPSQPNNGSWILNGTYSTLTDWVQLAGPGQVLSVNDKVGIVVLDAEDVGAVPKVADITPGTKCKITFTKDGLVAGGEDLESTDLPSVPAAKLTGTVAIARLPTGNGANKILKMSSTGHAGQALRLAANGMDFEFYTPSSSSLAMFTGTITGDGSATVFTFNHGLSGVPLVTLMDSTGKVVTSTIEITSTTISVTFHTAPSQGETYTVKAIA